MTALNEATKLYFGASKVDKVYTGSNRVWPPFLPSDLSGLAVWLDASMLTLADGADVTAWPDFGSADDPRLFGTGTNPTFRTNAQNGNSVVRFNTAQKSFINPVASIGVDLSFTVFVVGRMWGATRYRILAGYYTPANVLVGWWGGYEDKLFVEGWASPDPTTPASTNWKLYSADRDTSSVPRLFRNGVLYSTVASSAGGWQNTYHISPGQSSLNESSDCEVGEIIFYNRKLSDTDRQKVEAYLRAKWGL